MATPTSVEAYLAALPEDARTVLQELRRTIKAAAPEATETIAYQMPAFKSHGRFLVSYAAYKDHYSLFPASGAVMAALGDELTPYVTGKATIQFRANKALSAAVVTRIIQIRLAETAASSTSG
jgi:uncharacterized protein YdhG (YjbR/CyaY superfamily)